MVYNVLYIEKNAGGHAGFAVAKSGDGRVALIGFPSVGNIKMPYIRFVKAYFNDYM